MWSWDQIFFIWAQTLFWIFFVNHEIKEVVLRYGNLIRLSQSYCEHWSGLRGHVQVIGEHISVDVQHEHLRLSLHFKPIQLVGSGLFKYEFVSMFENFDVWAGRVCFFPVRHKQVLILLVRFVDHNTWYFSIWARFVNHEALRRLVDIFLAIVVVHLERVLLLVCGHEISPRVVVDETQSHNFETWVVGLEVGVLRRVHTNFYWYEGVFWAESVPFVVQTIDRPCLLYTTWVVSVCWQRLTHWWFHSRFLAADGKYLVAAICMLFNLLKDGQTVLWVEVAIHMMRRQH